MQWTEDGQLLALSTAKGISKSNSISCQWSLSIPFENIRKPEAAMETTKHVRNLWKCENVWNLFKINIKGISNAVLLALLLTLNRCDTFFFFFPLLTLNKLIMASHLLKFLSEQVSIIGYSLTWSVWNYFSCAGALHVYLTKLPILGNVHATKLAYLTSLKEVGLFSFFLFEWSMLELLFFLFASSFF